MPEALPDIACHAQGGCTPAAGSPRGPHQGTHATRPRGTILQLQLQAAVLAGSKAAVAAAAELRPATHNTQVRTHSERVPSTARLGWQEQAYVESSNVLPWGTWFFINQLARTKTWPGKHQLKG